MQLRTSIKKELMELFCTKRWLAFLLPPLYFVLFDPVMALVTPQLLEAMGMTEFAAQLPPVQSSGLQMFAADYCVTGLMVFALAMMKTAGGDQKHKTCIIPICNGMSRTAYILAKFIVYPALLLLESMVYYLLTYGFTWLLFEERMAFLDALLPMLAMALFVAFGGVLMLALGCMTGKGGISAAIVIAVVTVIPSILSMLHINRYNPLGLLDFVAGVPEGKGLELAVCCMTAAGAAVLLFLLTAAVFRRKRLAG